MMENPNDKDQDDSHQTITSPLSRSLWEWPACRNLFNPPDFFVWLPLSLLIKSFACTQTLRWAWWQDPPASQVSGTFFHQHVSCKFGLWWHANKPDGCWRTTLENSSFFGLQFFHLKKKVVVGSYSSGSRIIMNIAWEGQQWRSY